MAKKLTKALRGKRRWVGCNCDSFKSRSELESFLIDLPVKLYDFESEMCILEVRLEDYDSLKQKLASGRVVSNTSSGKIRLVRERMGFSRKPRKR
tara:strand:+ start:1270 stop:1554 length:285 start_codon:yes stop_codon:yes gene_type:complete